MRRLHCCHASTPGCAMEGWRPQHGTKDSQQKGVFKPCITSFASNPRLDLASARVCLSELGVHCSTTSARPAGLWPKECKVRRISGSRPCRSGCRGIMRGWSGQLKTQRVSDSLDQGLPRPQSTFDLLTAREYDPLSQTEISRPCCISCVQID
jgi:hypothetical protein